MTNKRGRAYTFRAYVEECALCCVTFDASVLTPLRDRQEHELHVCPLCWIEHESELLPMPLWYKLKSRRGADAKIAQPQAMAETHGKHRTKVHRERVSAGGNTRPGN